MEIAKAGPDYKKAERFMILWKMGGSESLENWGKYQENSRLYPLPPQRNPQDKPESNGLTT